MSYVFDIVMSYQIKLCIAHPYCARFSRQNVRDFSQTKLDNEINSPYLLNEHGDLQFSFQVFAKNSLKKNIVEGENKFDSGT